MRRARGFTLLEVMISLGILAVGLVAISNLNGGAVQMHAYSRKATEATLLLRGKMLDIEEQLQKNGFSDFNDEKHGDFYEESAPGYSWSAEILKPDVKLDATQLMSLIGGAVGQGAGGSQQPGLGQAATALAGALGSGGAPGPQPAQQGGLLGGPLGGVMNAQATQFIETLKKSVREIRLTVSWADGKRSQSISASQMVVILPEQVGQTQGAPQPQNPAAPGTTPGTPTPTTPLPRPGAQP